MNRVGLISDLIEKFKKVVSTITGPIVVIISQVDPDSVASAFRYHVSFTNVAFG